MDKYEDLLRQMQAVLAQDPSKAAMADQVVAEQTQGVVTSFAALQQLVASKPSALGAFGRGLGQGVSFGFGDEIAGAGSFLQGEGYRAGRDQYRQLLAQDKTEQPAAAMGGELVGAVGTGFASAGAVRLLPSLLPKVSFLRNATQTAQAITAGAAAGAAAGAGNAPELAQAPLQALQGGLGGAAGGAAGRVLEGGARTGSRFLRNQFNPAAAVDEGVAQALPDDILSRLGQREAAIPGQTMLADADPLLMQKIPLLVARDAAPAQRALSSVTGRVPQMRQGLRALGDAYEGIQGELPATSEVAAVLRSRLAAPVRAGQPVDLQAVIRARSELTDKIGRTRGFAKRDLAADRRVLTDFLEQAAPDIRQLDARYRTGVQMLKEAPKLQQRVERAVGNYAGMGAAGETAMSSGGSIANPASGLTQSLMRAATNKSPEQARRVEELLFRRMTPSSPELQALMRIRKGLLAPRYSAAGAGALGGRLGGGLLGGYDE